MNITSVTVRRLKTLQGYNNIAIEASATVQPGEVPSAVLDALDFWVQDQIEDSKGVSELRAEHQIPARIHRRRRKGGGLTMPRIFTCTRPNGQSVSIDLDRIEVMHITLSPRDTAETEYTAVLGTGNEVDLEPQQYADILKAWQGDTTPAPDATIVEGWSDEYVAAKVQDARIKELQWAHAESVAGGRVQRAIEQRMDDIRAGKA